MPTVEFLPSGLCTEVSPGTELLEAARRAGVELDAFCGGQGTCGTCRVRVATGWVDMDASVPAEEAAAGWVQACNTRVLDSHVRVEVPEQVGRKGGQFVVDDAAAGPAPSELLPKDLLPAAMDRELDPLAVKRLLHVPPPQLEDGLSDLDRVKRALSGLCEEWGTPEVVYTLSVMRAAAEALRTDGGDVTLTLIRERGRLHVIGIEAGDCTSRLHGIAVDVGTTTVSVQLIDLCTGRILATRTDYNAQIPCGLDVISRINYARRPGGLEELRRRAMDTVNRLIHKVADGRQVEASEIRSAVISGNTTMIHLLLGLGPEYIRLEPYAPTVLEAPLLRAAELGLEIDADAGIFLSPCVGSYMGGDIAAGLLCTDLVADTDAVNLFLDIGTNGELVIGNAEFLLACACSAGPAFEGGGIDCGMRAATGAIERVEVDAETGQANLLLAGWIDLGGRLDRSRPSPCIEIDGKRARYLIASAEETPRGKPIAISEAGIENIIRAKAAIYSASSLMLKQVGLAFSDLANIYIAGGFGRFLDLEKAITIGLIPDLPRERFHYIGNASLLGSYRVAVSRGFRRRQQGLARRMTNIELSADPAYMDEYTGALFLPHTDLAQFPSVADAVAKARGRG
ncbi:MAG: DUF4445 domain-containing protein [Deltaproteobacteria bacterium]|nr:DUF4445 domain-containing protein [Deltaproteobacteria bacterium]